MSSRQAMDQGESCPRGLKATLLVPVLVNFFLDKEESNFHLKIIRAKV